MLQVVLEHSVCLMRPSLPAACPGKRTTDSAEGYLNRYRNGWATSAAAVKAWADETVRRRGKPLHGQPAVPLAELPVPVPTSRFQWPFVRRPLFSPAPCADLGWAAGTVGLPHGARGFGAIIQQCVLAGAPRFPIQRCGFKQLLLMY